MAIKLIFKCLHILSCECEFVINMLTRDNSQLNFHGGKLRGKLQYAVACVSFAMQLFAVWEFRIATLISHIPTANWNRFLGVENMVSHEKRHLINLIKDNFIFNTKIADRLNL
jgi:hypothetical protein